MNLDQTIRDWQLSDLHEIAKTATSTIYKVSYLGKTAILKYLTETGTKDEAFGAKALRAFKGNGAALLYLEKDQSHLIEYISGPPLSQFILKGQDHLATEIACRCIKSIHQMKGEINTTAFETLEKRFEKLYTHHHLLNHPLLTEKTISILKELLSENNEQVLLHGDIHHNNILFSEERGWLLIDPKGIIGERTFDYVNIIFNPTGFEKLYTSPERIVSTIHQMSEIANLDRERLLKFAFCYGCLSAIWSIEDQFDPSNTLKVVNELNRMV